MISPPSLARLPSHSLSNDLPNQALLSQHAQSSSIPTQANEQEAKSRPNQIASTSSREAVLPSVVTSNTARPEYSSPARRPRSNTNGQPTKAKSCAECRRLKLKCVRGPDGGWPCSQCERRKCSEICPSLIAAPSAKASNERLLRCYRDRIASLEAELLETRQLLKVKAKEATPTCLKHESSLSPSATSSILSPLGGASDDAGDDQVSSASRPIGKSRQKVDDETGLMSSNDAGGLDFFGRSAADLYTCDLGPQSLQFSSPDLSADEEEGAQGKPESLVFAPFGNGKLLSSQIKGSLPPQLEAEKLLEVYHEGVAWMYTPISKAALAKSLGEIYSEGPVRLHRHKIAVLFLALALGDIFEVGMHIPQRSLQQAPRHRTWFQVSSKCLSEDLPTSFLANPTPEAAAALHLMTSYLFASGDGAAAQGAWNILGLGMRVALSMGMHRDHSRWGVDKDESLARSQTFWELMVYDRLQALNFGRPYINTRDIVECPPPVPYLSFSEMFFDVNAFHALKYKFCHVMERIVDTLSSATLPHHSAVMSLDQEVRKFESSIPNYLCLHHPLPEHIQIPSHILQHIVPQRHMVCLLINKALLFLHRPYFAQALLGGGEPLLSDYATSFAAAIGSARHHTRLFQSVLETCPRALSWWFFIFHAFSAAVIQAFVLRRAKGSMLSSEVERDFEQSFNIFTRLGKKSSFAKRALPALQKMRLSILMDSENSAVEAPESTAAAGFDSISSSVLPPTRSDTTILNSQQYPRENYDVSHDSGIVRGKAASMQGLEKEPRKHVGDGVDRVEERSRFPIAMWNPSEMPLQPVIPDRDSSNLDLHEQEDELSGEMDSTMEDSSPSSLPYDLSDVLMSNVLPEEFQAPAEWTYLDPLLQSVIFWHPESGSSFTTAP